MGIVKAAALAFSILSVSGVPDSQVEAALCLTEIIHYESNGEGWVGKKAVANTTLNRVQGNYYPDTICQVLEQPGQFSHKNQGLGLDDVVITQPSDLESFEETLELVIQAFDEGLYDNTRGADHFFSINISTPSWARNPISEVVIGNHRFLRLY